MRSKKQYRLYLGVVAVVVLYFLVVRFWFPGRSFDAALWKSADVTTINARHGMADRFVARQTLIGMVRPQILEMLGEPVGILRSDKVWNYELGRERGFNGIDTEWLEITFGDDDRVVAARVWTD